MEFKLSFSELDLTLALEAEFKSELEMRVHAKARDTSRGGNRDWTAGWDGTDIVVTIGEPIAGSVVVPITTKFPPSFSSGYTALDFSLQVQTNPASLFAGSAAVESYGDIDAFDVGVSNEVLGIVPPSPPPPPGLPPLIYFKFPPPSPPPPPLPTTRSPTGGPTTISPTTPNPLNSDLSTVAAAAAAADDEVDETASGAPAIARGNAALAPLLVLLGVTGLLLWESA